MPIKHALQKCRVRNIQLNSELAGSVKSNCENCRKCKSELDVNANSVKSKYRINQNANRTCPTITLQKCRVRNIESNSELAG